MKIQRKHIIAGAIGVITIAGALAYLQYKKIMDYAITLKKVKLNTLSFSRLNFDILLSLENRSKVEYVIKEQEYEVFIDNIFVSKIKGTKESIVKPISKSDISLNVSINPKDVLSKIGKNATSMFVDAASIKLKVIVKLKVKIYGMTASIPYVYEDTLKNISASK